MTELSDREDEDEPDDAGPTPRVTEVVWCVKHPATGKLALACFAKRTYALGPRLTLSDEQAPLLFEPEMEIDERYDSYKALLDDADLVAPKEATDVVVMGKAYAPERTRELHVAVAVSGFARRLRVLGERRVDVQRDGSVKFSSAEAFEEIDLRYDHAYGGYDAHAQAILDPPPAGAAQAAFDVATGIAAAADEPPMVGIFAYPRNAAGAGYFLDVDRARADGARLPRIEDPGDELLPDRFFVPTPTAWIDAPIPGHLGWMHHAYYPRFARFMGPLLPHDPPARPIRETSFGDGADLVDMKELKVGTLYPRALNGAAPGLAVERLRGDEPVVLQNLRREMPDLRFALPGEAPRFAVRPPDIKVLTPRAALQTVRIDTVRATLSMTWCAVVPLLAPIDAEFLSRTDLEVTWGRL